MDRSQPTITSESEKRKRVIKNIIAQLIYNASVIGFGLVLPRLYLVSFGSDVNGLVSTVKDIFAYLALLEAGVGVASQYALYRPVAKGEKQNINEILSATRYFYRRTGIIYAGITLALAVIYPLVMKTNLDFLTVFIIIMLYGLPGIVTFLTKGKYRPFLEVEGKSYIFGYINTATIVLGNALRLFCLLFTDDLLLTDLLPGYCDVYLRKAKIPLDKLEGKAEYSGFVAKGLGACSPDFAGYLPKYRFGYPLGYLRNEVRERLRYLYAFLL